MNLIEAMAQYGLSDKERFCCSYPEWQEKRPSTTFFADFSVADVYGEKAIRDTYSRAFNGWKHNVLYFTELVAVLNHKIWQHYQTNDAYGKLYNELWQKADAFGVDHFKGEEARHFFSVLDQPQRILL